MTWKPTLTSSVDARAVSALWRGILECGRILFAHPGGAHNVNYLEAILSCRNTGKQVPKYRQLRVSRFQSFEVKAENFRSLNLETLFIHCFCSLSYTPRPYDSRFSTEFFSASAFQSRLA